MLNSCINFYLFFQYWQELSRKSVIEEQEQSEKRMQVFLAEERKKFQQIIEEQVCKMSKRN